MDRVELSEVQKCAIQSFEEHARKYSEEDNAVIKEVLYMSNISHEEWERCVGVIKGSAQVAIHFHPDRVDKWGNVTIEALLESGIYKNQFETGISAGGMTAYVGGDRDRG